MSSTARWCRRFAFDGPSSLVALHAPAHLLLGVDHAALKLERADDGPAHSAHEVALKPVGSGDCDHLALLAREIGKPLDGVVGRVAAAGEDDTNAVDRLLGVGHRPGVMRVEDD